MVELKLFQCHEWVHFNFNSIWLQQFNLFHFLCALLFPRYASSVTLWLDPESSIPSKLASPSLCPTSILCYWRVFIPPYRSSYSSCCISALTSTSLPSNIMLYNKQHVTTLKGKKVWRLFLTNNSLKIYFNIPKAFSTTLLPFERHLLYSASKNVCMMFALCLWGIMS